MKEHNKPNQPHNPQQTPNKWEQQPRKEQSPQQPGFQKPGHKPFQK